MLFAYPWAEGQTEEKFAGDSQFYPNLDESVPTDGTDDFSTLLKNYLDKYFASMANDGMDSPEDLTEQRAELEGEIAGFWLVEQSVFETIAPIYDDLGGDSATYRANRAAKRVLDGLATRQIHRPS